MKLHGIGASVGIAVAKTFLIKENKIEITNDLIKDTNKEKDRINKAINETTSDIQKIKEKASTNLSQEELSVFDAHIQVAKDPMILQEIFDLIDNEKNNAVFATKKITDKYSDMFSNMDDEYMKERAADIKDVAKKIINNLLGIKEKDLSSISEEVIIISHDLSPSQTALLNKKYVKGFITNIGGRTSHAAIMARSLEIPAVLGLKDITSKVKENDTIALDGENGTIIINPSKQEISSFQKKANMLKNEIVENQKYKNKKSKSLDGKHIEIAANIGSPKDVDSVLASGGEGIGLFRSEFLYMDALNWPSEEEQFVAYKSVLEKMKNHKVVIRTLDIGGDKKLNYYNFPEELNPFLGYRAIRFCLDNKKIFRTQIKALLRASYFGKLAIMFPMIATINEFLKAKKIVQDCHRELEIQKIKVANDYEIGMMVEIPATAVIAKQFAKHADFFSIGTNDLMQYTMAADRMSEKVSYLYQPLNPSILNMVNLTIEGAHAENKWVGMCGEMAGDKNAIPLLLGMGLDEFSMSATSILRSRKLISKIDSHKAQILAKKALSLSTQEEVEKLVKEFQKKLK